MYKRHVWIEAMGRREIWNAFMLQYRIYRHAKTVIHKYGMGIIYQDSWLALTSSGDAAK